MRVRAVSDWVTLDLDSNSDRLAEGEYMFGRMWGHGHGGGPGCGGPGGGGWGGPFRRFRRVMFRGVEFSDDQLERMSEKRGDLFSAVMHGKADAFDIARKIWAELGKDNVDKDVARSLHKQLQERLLKLGDTVFEHVLSMSDILSHQQRKQVHRNILRAKLDVEEHQPPH